MKYEQKKPFLLDKSVQHFKPTGGLENNKPLPANTRKAINKIVSDTRVQAISKKTTRHSDSRRTPTQGVFALFSGPSGTGKTLAAQLLASKLEMDIYRVDLASVTSKYIGETEKNLSKVLERAEKKNLLLLFDEADALLGKRSEVRDSHDRYANLEVAYLLQRMEGYGGIAILAVNNKENVDPTFMRRFQYILEFRSPDEKESVSSNNET